MTQQTYAAYLIDAASRAALLARFPAKYPETVAHHITHHYGGGADDVPPQPQQVNVVGYHDSGAIQVLVVEVDGRKNQVPRTAGETPKFYHITLSYDPAQGVSPSKSNDVLEKIVAEKGLQALRNLREPLAITVAPVLLVDHEKPASKKTVPPQP